MEDRVTLVKMSYYDQWTQGSATVWGWTNCEDIGAELPAPSEVGQSYYYTADDAWNRGMKSGEMESYQLPWGYELILYDQDGLTGNTLVLKGNQNTDAYEYEECITLDSDWRNRARSYEVKKIQDIGEAKVRWVYFAATEGIDVQVHYGFESTNTETTTEEQTATL